MRSLCDTPLKSWTLPMLEGMKTATKRADTRKKKKKLSSSFPLVEKLNKEGNKEAGFNGKSLKISLNASEQ